MSEATTADWRRDIVEALDGYVDLDMGTVDVSLGGSSGVRHAQTERFLLCALLLEGQPFGFTWNDVDALRAIEGSGGQYEREEAACRSIADRIAALLPPRKV